MGDASKSASHQTLAALIEESARRNPHGHAILAMARRPLSYAGLQEHVSRTAAALKESGLGRSDRVAIVLPNGPEIATAFLSVSACATSAPLNPAYRAKEFDFCFSDLNARALIVQAGVRSVARDAAKERGLAVIELEPDTSAPAGIFGLRWAPPRRFSRARINSSSDTLPAQIVPAAPAFAESDDVALVLHTSGTTSRPKMVPLTQANLCASAENVAASLALTASDRCLNVMPLFHIHGLVAAVLASLRAGGSVVCTPGFLAPHFFEWMEMFSPTWYTAVPTIHQAILARARQANIATQSGAASPGAKLRLLRSSSAALPPPVMAELEKVFNAPVIEAYGMTEAAHQMASNPLPPRERKPGSVGPAAGPEIAVMDEHGNILHGGQTGEIVIRGTNVTRGYKGNPEANESAFSNGWFRTGDQGTIDQDGYLFLTSRLKEIINRGGEKISPREVDEVLLQHPAVEQVAAFAAPDPRLGEDIAAAIVLRPGETATAHEIRHFAAAHLADFKVPRTVVFVKEIPKGPSGKLQRIGLAEKLGITGAPAFQRPALAYEAPRTEFEKLLAALWQEVLKVPRVGASDDFLELGGDSILAAQLVARLRERLEIEITIASFFEASTVAAQADLVGGMVLRRSAAEDFWRGPRPDEF